MIADGWLGQQAMGFFQTPLFERLAPAELPTTRSRTLVSIHIAAQLAGVLSSPGRLGAIGKFMSRAEGVRLRAARLPEG